MRLLAYALLLFFCPASALAQLYEIKANNQWGLMDRTGRVVLEPTFDYLYPSEDSRYFLTQKGGKTGLYHIDLGEILPPKYDQIFLEPDDERSLKIVIEGKYGLLRPEDNQNIPAEYDAIDLLFPGCVSLRKGKRWGLRHLTNEWSLPVKYRRIFYLKKAAETLIVGLDLEGRSHVWNQQGERLIEAAPVHIKRWSQGVFLYQDRNNWGILGKGNTPVTPAAYDHLLPLGPFFKARANVRWGILSPQGDTLLDFAYRNIRIDTSGHIWFSDGERWGLLSPEGEPVFPPTYDAPGFFEGPVSRIRNTEAYGVINRQGDTIVPLEYEFLQIYPGMVRAYKDTSMKQFRFDEAGNPIRRRKLIIAESASAYKFLRTRSESSQRDLYQEYGWFQRRGKWGIRDTIVGRLRLKPRYDSVRVYPQHEFSIVGLNTRYPSRARYGLFHHRSVNLMFSVSYEQMMVEDLERSNFLRAKLPSSVYELLDPYGRRGRGPGEISLAFDGQRFVNAISAPSDSIYRFQVGRKLKEPLTSDQLTDEGALRNINGRWGLILPNGERRITSASYIGPFSDGAAAFRTNELWGLLGDQGKELLPAQYMNLIDHGLESPLLISHLHGYKFTFLDIEGKFLFEKLSDSLAEGGQQRYVNAVGTFQEGKLPVRLGKLWGFMDEKGAVIIPPTFAAVQPFAEGLAPVKVRRNWGFIDQRGESQIKNRYRRVRTFQEGWAAARKGKRWGYLNAQGKWAVKARYINIEDRKNGLAIVRKKKMGLLDADGSYLLKPKYQRIERRADWIYVKGQNQQGYLDAEGEWAIPMGNHRLGGVGEGKVPFQQDQQWGYLQRGGEVLIEPSYRSAEPFSEGLAAVRKDRKWGYLNEQDKVAIRFRYARAGAFQQGVAIVGAGKPLRYGLINQAGDTLIPLEYERIEWVSEQWLGCRTRDPETKRQTWEYRDRFGVPRANQRFESVQKYPRTRFATASLEGMTIVLDPIGTPIVVPGFDRISAISSEVIVGASQKLCGLVNRKGEIVLPPTYEHIRFRNGLYQVIHHNQVGYLNEQLQWVRLLSE
ncbi:MAG: WG repeat-containing protein [Bacteroidota bacterium]